MPFPFQLLPPENNPPLGSNPYDLYYSRPRYNFFYYLTGFSFFAFAAGFTVCLFDMSQISQCVDYAESMVDVLKNVGEHIIQWAIAVFQEIRQRHPF